MKSITNFFKADRAMRRFIFSLSLALLSQVILVQANQVDIGIFASTTVSNNIEVRVRPDFNISAIQTLTGILYTVRWDDPTVVIATQYIAPFSVAPQGPPVLYNGYYYQVFAATPMAPVAMNANQEYLISSFNFTNSNCGKFEIIEDAWTQAHNGNVYLELVGLDVTGIIYHPTVQLASIGGNISGSATIYLGNSTGTMTLSGYTGAILTWERKVNEGSWVTIPLTAGATTYSEIPPTMGDYYYRASIQYNTCPAVYSGIVHIIVVADVSFNLTVFLEGPFQNPEMSTDLNDLDLIPLLQPYYSDPWNYYGEEYVTNIPANAVDWVLIELRESAGGAATATSDKMIGRQAAFLMKDGSVKGLDGLQNPHFVLSLHSNLYIVISHRNHLSVISAISPPILSNTCSWNFSTGENQALGGNFGHKQLAIGIWGMMAGDASSDGIIDDTDRLTYYWNLNAGTWGYISFDFSMDSQVDNKDKNDFWFKNYNKESQVPD